MSNIDLSAGLVAFTDFKRAESRTIHPFIDTLRYLIIVKLGFRKIKTSSHEVNVIAGDICSDTFSDIAPI